MNLSNFYPFTYPSYSSINPWIALIFSSEGKSHPTSLANVYKNLYMCLRVIFIFPGPFTLSEILLMTLSTLASDSSIFYDNYNRKSK